MKSVKALSVMFQESRVGELVAIPRQGLFFSYDPGWLAKGFNLAPFHLEFSINPQKAADVGLFDGLHGAFSDSLPDGWGLLLMDRFFRSQLGVERHAISPLDRLAYMGNRSMGALEYVPMFETIEADEDLDLAALYEASQIILSGSADEVITSLRLAGGSPGGARPKAVIGLSPDLRRAVSSFGRMPEGYEHWLIKFRSEEEHRDSGAIEQAYALVARRAGIEISESKLFQVETARGTEQFFATKRFDREAGFKRHMLTAAAILYADFRAPSLDYSDLLRATWAMTRDAIEVEKMARLMVFNALAHNRDDHAKNFSFFGGSDGWKMAPAYDLTFSSTGGRGNEHTTAFAGRGKPTRKALTEVCKPFSFLEPERYIEQTLDAFSGWHLCCADLEINNEQSHKLQTVLESVWQTL
ncbi:type II toxin-antitoxin system HipA family toxin [Pseudomonas sp. B21-053]|uniref:type II toxin-antitoxin system HipA family toxin n=1 Tax=Pseudomonas sp. B21-053 TaxID=2895493 RepID=UPI0022316805|nr:type II toxin-antitoxin system HipA family toxin [Pseudomonas sp. B21-053]UZE11539.1 type II toxin-antitoxin system HipA family toxin [Pseudomonas sp. B21-053]